MTNKATLLSQNSNTLSLDLDGMTCAACAARIERVISKNESIESVSVNFPLKKAVIKSNKDFEYRDAILLDAILISLFVLQGVMRLVPHEHFCHLILFELPFQQPLKKFLQLAF